MFDLLPLLKRKERERFERQELKQAIIDVGVFVVMFVLGLVLVIIL
jgi:hypothetical protein